MNDLSIKANIRRILAENSLYPKKNLGQNFLTDAHVLSKIIDAADVCDTDLIIEIGPGLGVLTAELSKRAKKVIAVEIDTALADILKSSVAANTEIINSDILKTDLRQIIADSSFKSAKIVANLPYYITTPIIFSVFENSLPVSDLVVMVQKEVAERMLASPSTKAYGLLTLSVAYYGKCSLVANVPPNSFFPRPDVHSAVVKIHVDEQKHISRPQFFPIIKAAFANRRKTLQNCLAASKELGLSKEDAAKLLSSAGLREDIRGEALYFDDFARLTSAYSALKCE